MNEYEHKQENHFLCRAILEIVGGPKEHIEKSLKDFVNILKKQEIYDFVKEEFAETEPHGELFSTFVEIELWIPDFNELFAFCIDAMPSSIEILEPSTVNFPAQMLTNSLNDLQQKLHNVDMRLKQFQSQKTILEQNTITLAANLVGIILKDGTLKINEISKKSGIPEEKLSEFLKELIAQGRLIKNKDESYSLKK